MAVSVVAGSAVVSNGTTGTAAVSATPTLPAGTVSGDRVFLIAAAVGTMATPSGWTQIVNTALGGGTAGASTGTRNTAVWYIDYAGVALPSVTAASVSANSIAVAAVTLRKGATDVWSIPNSTSGNDTTSGTGYSAAGSSIASPTNGAVILATAFPSTTTTSAATLTQTGATFSTLTNSVVSGGTTTGNDVAIAAYTATITTGATAAPTHVLTLGTARTGGTAFIFQAITQGAPITDTYTRTSTTVPGTADTGQVWTAQIGTWGTDGANMYTVTNGDGDQVTIDTGSQTQDISTPIAVIGGGTSLGIMGRWSDTNNFWVLETSTAGFTLKRVQAGTYNTIISASATVAAGQIPRMVISEEAGGTRVRGVLDGVELINFLDNTAGRPSGTKVGFRKGFAGGTAPKWSSFSETATAAPTGQPTLTVGTVTHRAVSLSWTAVLPATEYEVQRNGVSVAYLDSVTGATSWTDVGLNEGTAYTYRVRAINADGSGPLSVAQVATTIAAPALSLTNLNFNSSPLGTYATISGTSAHDTTAAGPLGNDASTNTMPNGGSGGGQWDGVGNATPDQLYSASCFIYISKRQPVRISIEWHDSGGALISTTSSSEIIVPRNTWTELVVSGTAPALTASATATAYVQPGGTGAQVWGASDVLKVQGYTFVAGGTIESFHGSVTSTTNRTYAWTGTVDNSNSTLSTTTTIARILDRWNGTALVRLRSDVWNGTALVLEKYDT